MFTQFSPLHSLRFFVSNRRVVLSILAVVSLAAAISLSLRLVQSAPGGPASPLQLQPPTVTLNVPGEVLIGEDFEFEVRFKNNLGSPIGYAPYIDLYLPASGWDDNASNEKCDGISFVSAQALFNSPPTVTLLPANNHALVANECPGTYTHPFTGANVLTFAPPLRYQLVVLALPFGSFDATQPEIIVRVKAHLSDYADVGTALPIKARGGFRYGETPTDDHPSDPLVQSFPEVSDQTIPTLFKLKKEYLGPEDEAVSGPNFIPDYPLKYKLTADIADGQPVGQKIDNLVLTDNLPPNLQFAGNVQVTIQGSNAIPVPNLTSCSGNPLEVVIASPLPIPPPSGTLSVTLCSSITGSTTPEDVVVTFDFFIPDVDANGLIIDKDCSNAPVDVKNDILATGDWVPLDPRDPDTAPGTAVHLSSDLFKVDHLLKAKCLAIQKSVQMFQEFPNGEIGATPGDILKYELKFQVSDYFTIGQLVVTDFLADGQDLETGAPGTQQPTFTVTDLFGTTGSPSTFPAVSMTSMPGQPVPGFCPASFQSLQQPQIGTMLRFDVSSAMFNLPSTIPRHSAGILTGGYAAGLPPIGTAATGTIVFYAKIRDTFMPPVMTPHEFVDKHDPINNCVKIDGAVYDNVTRPNPINLNTNIPTVILSIPPKPMDTSAVQTIIVTDTLMKSVYAVKRSSAFVCGPVAVFPSGPVCSNLPGPPQEVRPGDEVTFHIEKTIPSSDAEDLTVEDWLPLPIFDVNDPNADGINNPWAPLGSITSGAVPPPGTAARLIPDHTLSVLPAFIPAPATNSLQFDYGTFNSTANVKGKIDLLFTMTVTNDPFADDLFLTNEVRERESNSFGVQFEQVSIAQVNLREPDLKIRKGVIATDNPHGLFSQPASPQTIPNPTALPPPGPPGATLSLAGIAGVVNSNDLATGVLDSKLDNVDANDLVTFAITIENQGGHPAFNVKMEDIIPIDTFGDPSCFTIDQSSIKVQLGTGVTVNTALYVLTPTISGGFSLTLLDPIPELNATNATTGDNIIVITFQVKLKADITPGCCQNQAKITQYASIANGPNFVTAGFNPPYDDSAEVCTKPTLTKSVVATSEVHTAPETSPPGTPQVAIGEIVRYRLEVRLPEGSAPNFKIADALPPGMKFLNDGTARLVFTSNGGITTNPVLTTLPLIPSGAITGGTGCGVPVTFSLGDVLNNDNDPDLEFVVIEFNALVCNVAGNQDGVTLSNTFSVSVNNATIITSPPISVIVREPNLTITKAVSPTTVVQGVPVTYTVTITNSGPASAFDMQFADTLPSGLNFVPLSVAVSGSCLPFAGASIAAPFVTCAEIPASGVVTITYKAVADPTTCPVTLTNNARTTWTSLPGPNGTTTNNPPMSTTPGASGAPDGERDGSAPSLNDYVANASAPLTVLCPPCASVPAGIVDWWPFDEAIGTASQDIAGLVSNVGTHNNGPTPILGRVGGALCFDGVNDYVQVPDAPEIDFPSSCSSGVDGPFTIDAWVRTNDSSGVDTIIDKRVNPNQPVGYSLFLLDGRLGFQLADGGNGPGAICGTGTSFPCTNYVAPPTSANVASGDWHLVAVTVTKCPTPVGKMYVDGNLVQTFTPRTGTIDNNGALQIGRRDPAFSETHFDGCIDELEFFNRALAQSDIEAIFKARSSGKCKCPPITLNPPAGALPAGVVNIPYSQTFTATGGCSSSLFTYSVTGTLPPGLTFSNGVLSGTPKQAGVYTFTVTATDKCGCSRSQTYTLTVDCPMVPLPLFNTGVAADGSLLASGATDPHYVLLNTSPVGPPAIVLGQSQIPGVWLDNDSSSQWIGPDANPLSNSPAGDYTYQVTFDMPAGADLSTAIIAGQWASDNEAEIFLNTSLTGVTIGTGITIGPNAFGAFTPFVITGPFMQGLNTLDFVVHNRELQTGLRVEMNGSVRCCPPPKADKCVITTSELHTMPANSNSGTPQVAIGEIIRYRLTVTLPEGVSPAFRFTDHLPPGLTYLGNPKVAFVSTGGTGTITSTALSGSGLNFNASSVGACSGPTPTFVLPASQVTGGPFSSGIDPTFNLGTLTNSHSDPNLEYVIVEFNALVNNLPVNAPGPPNQNGATLSNFYDVFIGIGNPTPIATSTPTNVTVVEPHLDLQKTVTTNPGTTQATFTATIKNTGTAAAFDVQMNDVLPTGLVLISPAPSVSVSPGSCAQPTLTVNGNALTVTAPTMPVGCTVTLTFTVGVSSTCSPQPNIAQVSYTSLPGGSNSTPVGTQPNNTGSVTPGPTGAVDGDRVYNTSAQAAIGGGGTAGGCGKPSCGCPLKISRFRANGPAGTGDEFVEIFNPSDSPVLVSHCSADPGGSANGIGVFVSSGNGTHPIFGQAANVSSLACQIPGNAVIAGRGYYLCGGKDYSLRGLGNNGGTSHSVPDQTIGAGTAATQDIPDDAGLALLNIGSNIVTQYTIGSLGGCSGFAYPDPASGNGDAVVYDKVGFRPYGPGSPINVGPGYPLNIYPSLASQYCEGTCLQPVGDASTITLGPGTPCPTTVGAPGTSFPVRPGGTRGGVAICYGESGQYEILRRQTLSSPIVGTLHRDTDNNPDDFILVSPNSTTGNVGLTLTGVAGVTSVLGAAGPYNSQAPPDLASNNFTQAFLPGLTVNTSGPQPNPVNIENNPLGTITFRFTYTNTSTTKTVTGLRFKVDDLSTLCGNQTPIPNSALSTPGTGDAQNLKGLPNCQGTTAFTAILKALNSATTSVLVNGVPTTFNGTVLEDLSVGPPSPGALSPFGGGIDNSLIVNPSSNPLSVGDGVTGGSGVFATSVGPLQVLHIQLRFGKVRGGSFKLLITPMAITSP